MILPRELKAAAGPNPDPKSDDDAPSETAAATVESMSTPSEGVAFPVPVFPASGLVSTPSKTTRDTHLSRAPLPVSVPDDLRLISIPTVPEVSRLFPPFSRLRLIFRSTAIPFTHY
jgi:hypothetical protein